MIKRLNYYIPFKIDLSHRKSHLYKEKLLNTRVKTDNAVRLQTLLLDYHQFRHQDDNMAALRAKLSAWQAQRLQTTHQDLYRSEVFHDGLVFLLEELYAPNEFTQRDDDIDRIFPKMVKLLPDNVLSTVSLLIELNLLTQQLDTALAKTLFNELKVTEITPENYAEAYRLCDNYEARIHQIQLTANIGNDLDGFVRSKFLHFTIRISGSAAEMAGLGQLHQFLSKGFDAFHEMGGVDDLLDKIIEREAHILKQIFASSPTALTLPDSFYPSNQHTQTRTLS